jgi:hypothetical protein
MSEERQHENVARCRLLRHRFSTRLIGAFPGSVTQMAHDFGVASAVIFREYAGARWYAELDIKASHMPQRLVLILRNKSNGVLHWCWRLHFQDSDSTSLAPQNNKLSHLSQKWASLSF